MGDVYPRSFGAPGDLGGEGAAQLGHQGVRVLDAHRRRIRNFGELLWTLCALEMWYRGFVRGAGTRIRKPAPIEWTRRATVRQFDGSDRGG